MHGVIKHGSREHHAGDTADEQQNEADESPEHRGRVGDAAAIEGEQPVEHFHAGGDADQHGGGTEKAVQFRAHAHGEEMVRQTTQPMPAMEKVAATMVG